MSCFYPIENRSGSIKWFNPSGNNYKKLSNPVSVMVFKIFMSSNLFRGSRFSLKVPLKMNGT